MSKFEKTIVVFLIIFGIIMLLKKEKIINISNFNFRSREIVSDKYVEKNMLEKNFVGIKSISIKNPAGNIRIEKSKDKISNLIVKFRIYSEDNNVIKRIKNNVRIKISNTEDLNIKVVSNNSFPYKRLRVDYLLKIPNDLEINIKNRYGNIYSDVKCDYKLENAYGNIDIIDANRIGYIYNKYGNISVSNSECNKIESKYSLIKLKEIRGDISIKTKYSDIFVDKSSDLSIKSKFSKIDLNEVIGDVEIIDSYKNIYLRNIKGNVKIKSKFSKIKMENIVSKDFYLSNRYDDVIIRDFYTNNAYISLSNGDLKLNLLDLKDRLSLNNKYSNISLKLIKNLNPKFVVDIKYGKFINHSDFKFNILNNSPFLKIIKKKGTQLISLKIDYGNFELISE